MNLLLVEDNELARVIISNMLHKNYEIFNINFAVDGIQAMEKMKENNYDIVLLDLLMPNMSGYEVLDHISELDYKPYIIIQSISNQYNPSVYKNHKDFKNKQDKVKKIANDILVKPFLLDDLKRVINKFLQSKNIM